MAGWILQEELNSISADYQDFKFRAFIGPTRKDVKRALLKRDTPLDIHGITRLTANLSADDTEITVESTYGFDENGWVFIGTEFITYSGITATTFQNIVREYPVKHLSGEFARRFHEISDRVYGLNLSGTIDQHEFAATVNGEQYDHTLLHPDRSMYFEVKYWPAFGHQGPRINDGFSGIDGFSIESLFALKDSDGNAETPKGMDWDSDGNLWVVTDNNEILKVDPLSGEVLTTLTHSLTNLEGLAIGKNDALWVARQGAVDDSTVYRIDKNTGNTISSFDVTIQISGLAWDGTNLHLVDLNLLNIHAYSTDGTLQYSIRCPDPVPGGLAYWDRDLWVVGENSGRLYRIDVDNGEVYAIMELGLTNPTALAITQGAARVADSNDDIIHLLRIMAREGTQSGKPTTGATSLFTASDAVVGASWDDSGNLWLALDDDTIVEVNGTTGSVVSSFSSPVTGLTSIAHDHNGKVWVGSSTGTPKTIRRIELGPNEVDSTIEVPDTAVGLDHDSDNGDKYVLDASGNLHVYDVDGVQRVTATRNLANPAGLAKLSGSIYVIDGDKLKIFDPALLTLVWSIDLPDAISNAQAIALSDTYGHRVLDGTSGESYSVTLTDSKDDRETSGGWSEWLPFYFGYIEQGTIQANHLDKTWSLRCRSTWMYMGEEKADGRNLAPGVISNFKPVTCSSVLSDPALEIGTEYISSPGEGVGCQNIVDDDQTTVWVSQNRPVLEAGPDPMPFPIYGCPRNNEAVSKLREALSNSTDPETRIYLTPDDMDKFPASGWIVLDKGAGGEEYIQYTTKVGKRSFNGTQPTESYLTGLTRSNPQSHVNFTPVSGRGIDICGIDAPDRDKGDGSSESCFDIVTYGLDPLTGVGTGKQVPPWPGDSVGGSQDRRMIFTEVYRPRAGLRPEYNWWIELRNMSDRDNANIMDASKDIRSSKQGFIVVTWQDLDGVSQTVNIPLIRLANGEDLLVGPQPTQPPNQSGTCEKGWVVIVGDKREFQRWWVVPSGVHVLELRGITHTYNGSFDTPPGGKPLTLDVHRGEIKYYWYNDFWQHHTYRLDASDAGWGAFLDWDHPPEVTEIQVRDSSIYPEHGWGWIHVTADNRENYEWVKWSGKRTTNLPYPASAVGSGVLENVTRGYEGTVPRYWRGYQDLDQWPAAIQVPLEQVGRLILGYALPDPNDPSDSTSIYGDSQWKLSDWVQFGELQHLNVGVGKSFQRDGDNNWDWTANTTPRPGSKFKTGDPEWFSVDLGEVVPPTVIHDVESDQSFIQLTGDSSKLTNSGVILIDQEFVKYETLDRSPARVAPQITAELRDLTRGHDGTSAAQHNEGTQVWQVVNRRALVEHLVSGVSWHRKVDASDGIPEYYRIYTTWRPTPMYPNTLGWESDWDLIWSVSENDRKNRGHFIQEFADLDSGADSTRPPGVLGFHEARHVMMIVDQTNAGRAKINEFKVYSTNPRLNLLAGSLDRESDEDTALSEMQNSIAVFFDYVTRGFGLDSEDIVVIGTGVNFFELPIAGGTYQSILSQLANNTGYSVWFNRFNQLWFVPDPSTRRSMPIMAGLDGDLMHDQLQIVSRPSGNISQVTIYFRDELSDETFAVNYPEQPRGSGGTLEFDGLVVASSEEAQDLARKRYLEANGEWEVVATFGVGHHFVLGHRYTIDYSAWETSGSYFQGQNFYISGINYNITMGPDRKWATSVTLKEYHPNI